MTIRRLTARPAPIGSFTPSYWADRVNTCPGCSRSNWIVGRHSAECGFCATALPIAAPVQSSLLPWKKAA